MTRKTKKTYLVTRKKPTKVYVGISIEGETSFYSFGTKAKDQKAIARIRRWLQQMLTDATHIPLWQWNDSADTATQLAKYKVRVAGRVCK